MFLALGVPGALLAIYLIFVVDASVFPTLPEVFVVGFYYLHGVFGLPPALWAATLLGMALAGEATGNSLLYLIVRYGLVRRGKMPKRIERLMRRWTGFLILHDERIILLNRVIPVVPFVGAFIATLRWSYRKSLAFILIGAAAKYSALLVLVGVVGMEYEASMAGWITLALVVGLVGVSALGSYLYRRRANLPATRP